MAVDMQQMILNPIDRIAKLIKTLSGRHWKKKKKKEGRTENADEMSLTKVTSHIGHGIEIHCLCQLSWSHIRSRIHSGVVLRGARA